LFIVRAWLLISLISERRIRMTRPMSMATTEAGPIHAALHPATEGDPALHPPHLCADVSSGEGGRGSELEPSPGARNLAQCSSDSVSNIHGLSSLTNLYLSYLTLA
jgi:hypothetical protein